MTQFLMTLLVIALFPFNFAAAKAYGPAGCGLGSLIMGKENSGTVGAMTTNDIGTQTFAISSGTSNCVDSGVVRKGREARAFIEVNQIKLETDIAKGNGETLASLAQLYSCGDTRIFGSVLQKNYTQIFPTSQTTADHVESSIQGLLQSRELTSICQSI